MKRWAALASLVVLCGLGTARAAMLTDDFNSGISLTRWDMLHFDAAGSPWGMQVPDDDGRLRMFKLADSDFGNLNVYAIIDSNFHLAGDFSVSVDFHLADFPFTQGGWNEAVIRLVGLNSGDNLSSLRFTNSGAHLAEGFVNLPPYVLGETIDPTMDGRLIVTREGQVMSALIDRGSGPILLGFLDSADLLGPMKVQIYAAQIPHLGVRPTTALDVRFDNFTANADEIFDPSAPVPEPSTLSMFAGLGAMGLVSAWRKRKQRAA